MSRFYHQCRSRHCPGMSSRDETTYRCRFGRGDRLFSISANPPFPSSPLQCFRCKQCRKTFIEGAFKTYFNNNIFCKNILYCILFSKECCVGGVMGRIPITVMGYRCERCTHEWIPKNFNNGAPKVCPACKSPYWNTPKKEKMSYKTFRDKIQRAIREAGGTSTWTEIRTDAKLPQKFPNNQWVHKMEQDIGLERKRDAHGIIRWSLRYTEAHAATKSAQTS